jgi:hypothetical protein
MSRRTKLLITALFLVLLAIPAVYVIATWSVEHPLRFRCISALPEEMVQRSSSLPPQPMVPFIFEVRNTKSYPVHFHGVSVRAYNPKSPMPGKYDPMDYRMRDVRDKSIWAAPMVYLGVIPAHGTTCFEILVSPDRAAKFESGEIKLAYHWASRPRKLAWDVHNWVVRRLPRKDQFDQWGPYIDLEYGPATLEGLPVKYPRSSAVPTSSPPPP